MKNIIKILSVTLQVLLFTIFSVSSVRAMDNYPSDVINTLGEFINNLDDGKEEVFNYIDSSNSDLNANIQKYLYGLDIKFEIKDVISDDNGYKITGILSASGGNWNINGFSADIIIKNINGKYLVTDTTIFNMIGSENIMKMVFKFLIIGFSIFIGIAVIIAIIVIVIIKKGKKKNNIN